MRTNFSFFLFLSFLEGVAVMLVQLSGAKILAAYYGSGLLTWSSIIGITIFGLATGYSAGAVIGKRIAEAKVIHGLFLFIAVLISLIPVTANFIVGIEVESFLISSVVAAILLLFPVLFFLGLLSPVIIEYLTDHYHSSGVVSGKVFAVSTLGGIFAAFLAGFWLIPKLGIATPLFIFSIISGAIPLYYFLFIRKQILALIVPLAMVFVFLFHYKIRDSKTGVKEIIYKSEGLLGQIIVADVNKSTPQRIMLVNRMGQTWVNRNSQRSLWPYVDYILKISDENLQENADVLLLGLGGGILANNLSKAGYRVHAVEFDKRIPLIAKKYFNLSDKVEVFIDDARHYLRTTDEQYDLIIFDLFKGEVPPSHVLTVEAFAEVQKNLKAGGFIVINYNGFLTGEEGLPGRSLWKTLKYSGYKVNVVSTPGRERHRNNLFIASRENFPKVPFVLAAIPENELSYLLTDNKPMLEYLNIPAARKWREDYYQLFKNLFPHELPLFH